MRRDSIFYKLFQQSPSLLFELLANPPLSRVEVEAMLDMTLKETRVYREIKQEGREAMANAIARQLTKRLGELPQQVRTSVLGLPLPASEDLSDRH